jgi:hypothetical protein
VCSHEYIFLFTVAIPQSVKWSATTERLDRPVSSLYGRLFRQVVKQPEDKIDQNPPAHAAVNA